MRLFYISILSSAICQPVHSSDDFSLNLAGRVILDVSAIEKDGNSSTDSERRTLRLMVKGKVAKTWSYSSAIDYSDGIKIRTLNVKRRFGDTTITLGQFKTPNGINAITSGAQLAFLNRTSFVETGNFSRKLGAMTSYANGPLLVQVAAFKDSLSDGGDSNGKDMAIRSVWHNSTDDSDLHLGLSTRFRDFENLETEYEARAKARAIDRIFSYALTATHDKFIGGEFLYRYKSLYTIAEYGHINVKGDDMISSFDGGHADVGYVFGGVKVYSATEGRPKGIKMANGRSHAFEIGARYDVSEANHFNNQKDKQKSLEIAAHLYLPKSIRLSIYGADAKISFLESNHRVKTVTTRFQISF